MRNRERSIAPLPDEFVPELGDDEIRERFT